ncbi:MAG: glycosyltransferase family 2 protein [Bacteroidales bacterium]
MLSICIPIFNHISEDLIFQLEHQADKIDQAVEIILFDDHSEKDMQAVYKKFADLKHIRIHKSDKNLGRAGVRNRLAELSKHEYLLFIDADSETRDDGFLDRYLDASEKNTVCCGGTIYQKKKPDSDKLLRWKYGHARETVSAEKRNKNPWQQFTTHHFLIDKSVFQKICFSESIRGYGHEDSLFGYQLMKRNIIIKHIDNPLYHTGLESSDVFLEKSKKALDNLIKLYHDPSLDEDFNHYIRLLDFYEKQRKAGLLWLWKAGYRLFRNVMKPNLKGSHPKIIIFDLYKFSYFAYHIEKAQDYEK